MCRNFILGKLLQILLFCCDLNRSIIDGIEKQEKQERRSKCLQDPDITGKHGKVKSALFQPPAAPEDEAGADDESRYGGKQKQQEKQTAFSLFDQTFGRSQLIQDSGSSLSLLSVAKKLGGQNRSGGDFQNQGKVKQTDGNGIKLCQAFVVRPSAGKPVGVLLHQ